ncbi:MAG: hypothetical protein OQK82_03595 [Candidatus Pacearchaeota archaeon]|nr:hypothetical protein [Candidatus Pacearchaeota archaeon]
MNLDFPKYFGVGAVKTLHSFLGVPTVLRRMIYEETIFDEDIKINELASGGKTLAKDGFWIGYSAAVLGIASYVFGYAVPEAVQNRNYVPFAVLGVSNVGHGAIELGRFMKRNFLE